MHPNRDEIRAAKRVLNEAGYACIHIDESATWIAEYVSDLDGDGIAVTASVDEIYAVADQIAAIKKSYQPTGS